MQGQQVQLQWRQGRIAIATAAEAVSAVAVVATMAMAVANNNRNCGGGQQSTKWGRKNSGRVSVNRCSTAAIAGRGRVE